MMEITVPGNARKRAEAPLFHFVVFGNFSGRSAERESFVPREVGRANFEQLMAALRPAVAVQLELPQIDDLRLELHFAELRDFSERGLRRQVPLLESLRVLREGVAETSEERPLDTAALLADLVDGARLRELAAANQGSGGGGTIDLLSMVDLGDEPESYPLLHECLGAPRYRGHKRAQLLAELERLQGRLFTQLRDHRELRRLHGHWRGLRACLGKLPANVRVQVVDCLKDELCDALYLTCIQPESGPTQAIDLAIVCEGLAASEGDRHILHHLGRMGESLAVPVLVEVDLGLFGLRTYRQIDHLRELSAKLAGPAHLKWRGLRDEPGAHWLFLVFNPLRVKSEEQTGADETLLPAVFLAAALLGAPLETPGQWPAELLAASSDLAPGAAAKITPELGEDLAYSGICAVGESAEGELRLRGMTSFAQLRCTRPGGALRSVDLVPYSLAYRLYVGCCARRWNHVDRDTFRQLAAVEREEALEIEQDGEVQTLRLRPNFTIFGSRPDILLDQGS